MKLRGLSVTVALAAVLLAACSSNPSTSSGPQHVTMWIYPVIADDAQHHAFWSQTVAAFEKQNPNIKVDVQIFPWANRDTALATAIAGRKGPDVVYLIPDQIPTYTNSIQPLDKYLPAAVKSQYLPNVIKSVTVNGQLMGAPILTTVQSLICNKKVFAAVGQQTYPATWSDLLAMAPKFKAKGYDMVNYDGDTAVSLNLTFYPLLWQAGGDVFSPDGKTVTFNNQQGVQALTFLKQLVDGGYVDKSTLVKAAPIEQTAIAQGKVACSWENAPQDVASFWGNDNIEVLPPLKDVKQVQYGTVGSLVMLKGAKDKDAVAKWITYATSTSILKSYDTKASFFSPKKTTGSLYASNPVLGALEQDVKYTTVGPLYPKARAVMGVLGPDIQAALLGQKSPTDALNAAAQQAQALLGG